MDHVEETYWQLSFQDTAFVSGRRTQTGHRSGGSGALWSIYIRKLRAEKQERMRKSQLTDLNLVSLFFMIFFIKHY